MIRSMTGFGKGAEKSPYGKIVAEIKTLNHKSLSIACSPLNGFFLLEEKIKKIIEKDIHRGKVFVRISREVTSTSKPLKHLEINIPVAGELIGKIRHMQRTLKVEGEIGISDIVSLPGIVESSSEVSEDKLWPFIEKGIDKAMLKLIRFRKAEGKRLAKDLKSRVLRIKGLNGKIAEYSRESIEIFKDRLRLMTVEATNGQEPDNMRLESEVALFARNVDISEEITRLNGHIASYAEAIKEEKDEAGKKLDFIAQEMQREANTIGAKSSDIRVSKAVIEVKSEIEKMREQIKNIE